MKYKNEYYDFSYKVLLLKSIKKIIYSALQFTI